MPISSNIPAGDSSLLQMVADLQAENVALQAEIALNKRFYEELQESKRLLDEAQRIAKLGTWEFDPEHQTIRWSDEVFRIAGMAPRPEAPSFEEYLKIVHPDDRANLEASVNRLFSSGEGYELELRHLRPDGTYNYVITKAEPIFKAGKAAKIIGSVLDITERKHFEDALRHARDMANAANQAKSTFLTNMSHEIRTPLNSVLGMAQLALNTAPPPKTRSYLEKILFAGEHLLGIINDILDFSRIEAEKLEVENVDFCLDEIRQKLVNLIGEKVANKELRLTFDFDPRISRVLSGDPLRLSQILINYINNAIKFTEQGEITVRARKIEGTRDCSLLRFEVQDTGVGLTEEAKGKLFQPFQQADGSTTRKYGGSGLGLIISKRLAELMGGEVGVESEVRQGSTFWFTAQLGLAKEDKASAQTRLAGEEADAAALNGARILLVEDDPFNQEVAGTFLGNVGATLCIAKNGKEAIDLLHQQYFDCVLMDIQMPEMGGLEALQLIRSNPALAGLRVIAMTASTSNMDRESFLIAGMDDFIGKPFKAPVLYATLSKWLATQPPQKSFTSPISKSYAETSLANDPKIIDFAEIAYFAGNDQTKIHEFVCKFIASTREDIANIEAALEREDMTEVSTKAHRMMMPALMVGAKGFANLCGVLEKNRNSRNMEQTREVVSQLNLLLERIESQAKEMT